MSDEGGRNGKTLDRRTVLKGTLAASIAGVGTATFGGGASAGGARSFVVEQGDRCFDVTPLRTGESVEGFYGFDFPHSHTTTDIERSQVSNLFLFDGPKGLSLGILHDEPDDAHGNDSGGGRVTLHFSGLPDGGEWVVRDDNPGNDGWFEDRVEWRWGTQHTDGGVFRGGLDGDFEVTVDPSFFRGIDEWHLLSGDASDPERISLDMDTPITIRPGTCAIEVDIDVKPGSDPNAINPDSRGVIPVAILHTQAFDPVERVDVDSIRFGDPADVDAGGGADPAHGAHVEDVDGDGDADLVLHFPTRDADFDGDEGQGKLVGETEDGTPLFGTDSVELVGGGNGGRGSRGGRGR